MGGREGASRAGSGHTTLEGPTWLALAGCYGVWAAALAATPALDGWAAVPLALVIAFHSSLQHEILHGHPTRDARLNEALIFPALGLFIPYRRFRDLHLKHHNDERLTDPYDDPESFYVCTQAWEHGCGLTRSLLAINATLAGRLVIGPALALGAFWRGEVGLIRGGDMKVRGAWLRHAVGLVPVALAVWVSGIAPWLYLIAAYAGMSLIMVRSFIEHRAEEQAGARSAIVDGGLFWRLLFLNNNYHAVHHRRPALPWYHIPKVWRAERARILTGNEGYYLSGYGEVARRWLLRRREPMVHPLAHRDNDSA